MATPPKSTEIVNEASPIDGRITARFDKLDSTVEHLETSFKAVKETNSLIVIVLFVGFMGLLVAIFLAGIAALHSNADSNSQLNSTIQQLIGEQRDTIPATNASQ